MSDPLQLLPLFPLPDAVLFPKLALPLHIFELRYRKMVKDALAGAGVIGMTLLRPGWQADYEGRPPVFPIGCAGRIEDCEPLRDGRFNLVLRGLSRFRILEEHAGEPYRLARVETLSDPPGDPRAAEAARKRVLAAIGRASDGPSLLVTEPGLPDDVFVNSVSQSLELEPLERQSLLDCDDLLARCLRLAEILEFRALESLYGRSGADSIH
ncbi:MAG: LON peptidase substrate-binding domain-containing protein [Vicinamibacteria bacterium]